MKWRDPETGQMHSIYPTNEIRADLDAYWGAECRHEAQELRWTTYANGAVALRHQCLNCGELIGNPLPKSKATPQTRHEDKALRTRYRAERQAAYDAIFRKHVEQQARDLTNFKAQHAAYLASPEWRRKRQKVMERAGGLCEGCRERPATEVHHLTYDHWRDELLFELVALCSDCHRKCHDESDPPAR